MLFRSQPVYPPALQPPEPLHVPSPSPSPVSSLSKTLPTVSHIPILTSKLDFFAWDEGVNALIHANGLLFLDIFWTLLVMWIPFDRT